MSAFFSSFCCTQKNPHKKKKKKIVETSRIWAKLHNDFSLHVEIQQKDYNLDSRSNCPFWDQTRTIQSKLPRNTFSNCADGTVCSHQCEFFLELIWLSSFTQEFARQNCSQPRKIHANVAIRNPALFKAAPTASFSAPMRERTAHFEILNHYVRFSLGQHCSFLINISISAVQMNAQLNSHWYERDGLSKQDTGPKRIRWQIITPKLISNLSMRPSKAIQGG